MSCVAWLNDAGVRRATVVVASSLGTLYPELCDGAIHRDSSDRWQQLRMGVAAVSKAIGERGVMQRVRRSSARLADALMPDERTRLVVVAGYSGGADSLALIVVLRELDRLGIVRLVAVHVDHGVRAESAQDATTAAGITAELGIPFRVSRIDPEALARHQAVGLEEAMRRERYRLLAVAAREVGARVIATGHHRRDQAETVLLHLLRGAGLHGVAGMREITPIVVPWWGDQTVTSSLLLWRPLLGEAPETLRRLVETLGLRVIEDASNASEAFRRNAIRHQALPVLNAIVPGAEANLAAFAARAADDDVALDVVAAALLGEVTARLARTVLLGQPIAIQQRIVRRWVALHAPDLELTAERTAAMLHMAERNSGGARIEIGAGWQVVMRDGTLILQRA